MDRLLKAKIGVTFYFDFIGFVLGNWVARIPEIKTAHHLSDGLFGVVLLCAIGGACVVLPIISPLVEKYGSNIGLLFGSMSTIILVPIIGIPSREIGVLIAGIAGLGFGMGAVDVSMNVQATLIEKSTGRKFMGWFHANYAVGGFFGSIMGGLLAQANISPLKNFILTGLISFPLIIVAYCCIFSYKEEKDINTAQQGGNESEEYKAIEGEPGGCDDPGGSLPAASLQSQQDFQQEPQEAAKLQQETEQGERVVPICDSSRHNRCFSCSESSIAVITLSSIGFLASMGEGSVNDWSTLFFTVNLKASPFIAALAFALFSAALAIGRLLSDYAVERFGCKKLLIASGWFSGGGMALVVGSQYTPAPIAAGFVGFIICGAGLSVCSPVVMSCAGRVPGTDPTQSIAAVTGAVYLGVLIGPPLFGGLASLLRGLQWAFVFDACFMFAVVFLPLGLPSSIDFDTPRVGVGLGTKGEVSTLLIFDNHTVDVSPSDT